jgi:predicted alpha/beta superfamily hydrolase
MRWTLLVLFLAACGGSDNNPVVDAGGDFPDVTSAGVDAADSNAIDAGDDTPDAAPGTPDATVGGGSDASNARTDLDLLEELIAALPTASDRRALVQEFLREVAYSDGFPIRARGKLAVALWAEGDTNNGFTLAGDFNGWNATEYPLLQPVSGVAFYYRIVDVSEPLPRTLYKLVHDGTSWFADPNARRFGWDSYGEYSLAEAGTAVSHLERWPAFSQGAGALRPRTLTVYVPAGDRTTDLPVVYAHDGQNLFAPDAIFGGWKMQQAADSVITAGTAPRFFIVGVPNTPERFDEYTQSQDTVGGQLVGGRGDEYIAFLADGIKPFIDARYPTISGPSGTGTIGSSLGGLISLYAIRQRPDVFGYAASLSGTCSWGDTGSTIEDLYRSDPPTGAVIYLDTGGSPSGCGDNYCSNIEFKAALEELGWTSSTLIYRWFEGKPHSETAWSERLPSIFSLWVPR